MSDRLHFHFIAIGGSIMHGLAIALKNKGYQVTGSDDEIYEPSRSLLKQNQLLPDDTGWFPEKIDASIDGVILGMHAKKDNPELLKAQELGLRIYSFPDFIYEQSKDQQRIVIAGSHGKTTITAMIMHVLRYFDREFDYVVGAKLEGFENIIRLSDAPLIVIEGDEYLSSPIDSTPKFLKYHHHIGLISGIAWDHINVFPTEEQYVQQFELFADATPKAGSLAYCLEDALASMIGGKERVDVNALGYEEHPHMVDNGMTYLSVGNENMPLKIFGKHNMQNISGAKAVLQRIGISEEQFYSAIQSFKGAHQRLEVVFENGTTAIFKDFAHAPSKVSATTLAVRQQFPERDLIACLELHTYSSLNVSFLPQYKGALKYTNLPIVFFSEKALQKKGMASPSEREIREGFDNPHLKIFRDVASLSEFLQDRDWEEKNLLFMSSGNFEGLNLQQLSKTLVS